MFKKIITGILLFSVFGAAGAALAYNAARSEEPSAAVMTSASAVDQVDTFESQVAESSQTKEVESNITTASDLSEPWQASGMITVIDDFGFDFAISDAESIYVELGPPDYWQMQDIDLEVGQDVSVVGSLNVDTVHASQVILEDGRVLELRTETGQPLWSGSVDNFNGQNANHSNGELLAGVPVDEWITIEGTLMSFQGGRMTMGTSDGELITFQTGQPRFFASQGISFQVGDEIEVLGYYQNEQFMAGEITQVSTGLSVMLRDPNGRPLWAGPGSGNSSQDVGNQNNGNRGGGRGNRFGYGGGQF